MPFGLVARERTGGGPLSDEFSRVARETTNVWTVLVSIVFLVAGAALSFWAMIESNAVTKAVVAALAATLIPIGLVSITYEITLRRAIQRELLSVVGIERSLWLLRLLRGGEVQDVPWRDVLSHKTGYSAVLVEPDHWIDNHWHLLVESAADRKVSISFLIPDPEAPYIEQLASNLGTDVDTLRVSLTRVVTDLESRWDAAKRDARVTRGSLIDVRYSELMPNYSVIAADSNYILILRTAYGTRAVDPSMYLMFRGRNNQYPIRWLSGQLGGNVPSRPAFNNEAE